MGKYICGGGFRPDNVFPRPPVFIEKFKEARSAPDFPGATRVFTKPVLPKPSYESAEKPRAPHGLASP